MRQTMLSRFTASDAQYYLYIDSEVQLKPSGLKELIMRNKTLIAPLGNFSKPFFSNLFFLQLEKKVSNKMLTLTLKILSQ